MNTDESHCRKNETALYLSAKKNNIEIAKLLIEHGANVNEPSKCVVLAASATALVARGNLSRNSAGNCI